MRKKYKKMGLTGLAQPMERIWIRGKESSNRCKSNWRNGKTQKKREGRGVRANK
jgi:hypothetical protein